MWSEDYALSRHSLVVLSVEKLYDEVQKASYHEQTSGEMIDDDLLARWEKRSDALRARLGPAPCRSEERRKFSPWWMLNAIDSICSG